MREREERNRQEARSKGSAAEKEGIVNEDKYSKIMNLVEEE